MNSLSINRLRHRAVSIFLLGGLLGSALNVGISCLLYFGMHLNPFFSFFIGTLVNQVFHYFYYHVVYINQEIRNRVGLPFQLAGYCAVAGIGLLPLWALLHWAGLTFVPAILLSIWLLSVLNVLFIRVSTFASAHLAEIEYRDMGESFYDDQTDVKKVGRIRAWFHSTRHQLLTDFVASHYQPGKKIADMGCGNCWWNTAMLPVIGVDINQKMMNWAKQHGRLTDYKVTTKLSATGLESKAFDIVVMSETLEHLLDLPEVLDEVRRILKDDGTFLITVPNDWFLSPFFIMFNVNCLYQGYIKGSIYHRYRCGHVNHFSRRRLSQALAQHGFMAESITVPNHLTLYCVARKA